MNREDLILDRDAILANLLRGYRRIIETGKLSADDESYMSVMAIVHEAICRQLDLITTPPTPRLDTRRLDHAIAELERCLNPGTSSTPLVKGAIAILKQMQAKGGVS